MPSGVFVRDASAINNSVSPRSGRRLTPKLHMYDAIIDLMLTEPAITLSEIAKRLSRSNAWVGYMVHTDAFKDLYEERRREKNSAIRDELNQQLTSVALRSLNRLDEILEKNPQSVNVKQALEIADTTLERMGYGVPLPGASAPVVNNVNVLSQSDFFAVQEALREKEEKTITIASTLPGVSRPQSSVAALPGTTKQTARIALDPELDALMAKMEEAPSPEREENDDDVPHVMGSNA